MRNFSFRIKQYIFARGLGADLALAFSGLSIVLTLAIVAVIEQVATEQIETEIGHGLAELALQTCDKLDRSMSERYREVRLIAQRGDLTAGGMGTAERRRMLESLRKTYAYYAWIGLVDVDGRVRVAVDGLLEGADVSGRPWFRNALKDINLGDVRKAVLLAKLLPNPDGEPLRFVDVAFPYRDGAGRVRGVLGTHLSWQWARDIEQSVMRPIESRRQVAAFIVGADGTVLLGPKSLQWTRLVQPSLAAAQGGASDYRVESWPDGRTYLVGYSLCRGYGDYPGLGWSVLVRQDVDNAYQPVHVIRQRGLWSGAALALVFALLGAVVARLITKPLEDLTRSARNIQRGEAVELPPGAGGYYEVRALSESLNALVANLLQRKRDLRELNLTLERRVEERTQELAHALSAVQASERRINTIVETAQDAFVGVDLDGNVTDWNSQAERMFGWSRQEMIGRPLIERTIPERFRESFRKAIGQVRGQEQLDALVRPLERLVIDRHGVEFPVEMKAGLVTDSDGRAFVSVFLHDISERKKIDRMKNEFVSTVSHELRTPLTSIRASLSMLEDGTAGELPPDIKMLIDIAHDSCERLVRLVSDVLDIEKIESGNMAFDRAVQPLAPLLERAVEAMQGYAGQFGVTVRFSAGAEAAALTAEVDADRIVQVVTNLLSNAIKASPRGGMVDLDLVAHDGRARIAVADQGNGIPDEFRERIFRKFAQADGGDSRQKGGTGLGLTICKSIVEEHGGTISFESAPGKGTRFFVDLPQATDGT